MIEPCDGNSMKSIIGTFTLPLVVPLVSRQFATAQGSPGGNGFVAAIQGSVVIGHEPGLAAVLMERAPLADSSPARPRTHWTRS